MTYERVLFQRMIESSLNPLEKFNHFEHRTSLQSILIQLSLVLQAEHLVKSVFFTFDKVVNLPQLSELIKGLAMGGLGVLNFLALIFYPDSPA